MSGRRSAVFVAPKSMVIVAIIAGNSGSAGESAPSILPAPESPGEQEEVTLGVELEFD